MRLADRAALAPHSALRPGVGPCTARDLRTSRRPRRWRAGYFPRHGACAGQMGWLDFRASSRGAIAQLGERLHGMQEVGGSIPPGSTNVVRVCCTMSWLAVTTCPGSTASPSSRGLGHHPFTVDTGVRIPVGTPSCTTKGPPSAGFSSFTIADVSARWSRATTCRPHQRPSRRAAWPRRGRRRRGTATICPGTCSFASCGRALPRVAGTCR